MVALLKILGPIAVSMTIFYGHKDRAVFLCLTNISAIY